MTKQCHICNKEIKTKKDADFPPLCPVCGTDLENISSETVNRSISCEHLKGALGINPGDLVITNSRVFWISRADTETGNALVGSITSGRANKLAVDIPIGDLASIEDCKKLLRKGITVHTKTGESYNFFIENRGNPQILKDFLEPYMGK